eukprot:ANDGO_03705.mRNA.1 Uncharacterized protein At2g34160
MASTTVADNIVQVSGKRSAGFYANLAQKQLKSSADVELSGLGNAIKTVVSATEILKKNNVATVSKIETSSVDAKDEESSRKAKVTIRLFRTPAFEEKVKNSTVEDINEDIDQ